MKTSFYFFFWFIVYYLIGLTGIPLLIQNGFFVALILAFLISRLDTKLLYKEYQYQAGLNRAYIYEIFYSNDAEKMSRIYRHKCLGETICAIYCLLTVAGLIALRDTDVLAYVIFGLLGISSMVASSKSFTQYRAVKENGLPSFAESQFSMEEDSYKRYCELRALYPAKELLPKAPAISKWVNIASIIFALACIGGGLFYLYLLLFSAGHINILISAMLIWSVLAVFFGFKDLINSVRTLQNKPTPTLK